jgi:hypothetical protein
LLEIAHQIHVQKRRHETKEPAEEPGQLVVVAGGYTYRGQTYPLTGRALAMLRTLLAARCRRASVAELLSALAVGDATRVDWPEQVIKDTAKKLRKSLRKAVRKAGQTCPDPLPSRGRGEELTYELAMP